ncbi:MAG: vitamin K epoxide reductase family protein [Myxococcota bacterium]
MTTEAGTNPTPRRRWPLALALVLLTAGIGVAAYLVYVKLRLGYDPSFESACNYGGKFNCDQVQTHPASQLFGLPIALFAIPTYLVLAFLAAAGLRAREGASRAVSYLAGIGVLTVGHAAWLAWVSHSEIGFYCPYCMVMYGVNLGVTVLAFVARGGVGPAVKEALGGVARFARPAPAAAAVLVLAGGLSVLTFQQTKASMIEAEKARVAAEIADADTEADTSGDEAEAAEDGDEAKPEPKRAPRKPPEPKLTENGYDWFEAPVDEDDHVLGPEDAKVTYVSFKDFECGFCRYLSKQEKPLKEKYSDRVRFVFKHYPMNADCNYRMGNSRMHPGACRAARAAICAEEQDRFWDMHDVLYDKQKRFSEEQLRGYAEDLGLDMAAYDACWESERPTKKIEKDVRTAARARINGTPRVYIGNRLVTGSTATDVLDYYIQTALENPVPPAAAEAKEADESTPRMRKASTEDGPFWIDSFEASIDGEGRAVSVPGVKPALASWFEAKAACEEAGKRLCTEEEWVSACIGQPAKDADGDGHVTDGDVQGRMYPYGPYYGKDACRDSEDEHHGEAGKTGDHPACRTPEGVYDLTGNLYEWVGHSEDDAAMMGGDWRAGSSGTCRRRTTTYGAGIKNATTGFRCCADREVEATASADDVEATPLPDAVGDAVPSDLILETFDGGKLSPETFRGKVTYLTFFASWCGNCRKQMPAIKDWQEEWGPEGFQVVGIDVDRVRSSGERYVKTLEPNFTVAFDPSADTMSDFDIDAMPTSFIVDREGVIRKRVVGYRDHEIPGTKKAIRDLL